MAKKLNGLLSGHPLDCCDYWSIWRAENKRGILFFNRIVIFIFWNVKWYATTQRFGLDLCPLTVHAQCLHPLPWCTVDNPRYNVHQFMAHTVRKVCILSVGSLGSALIPMSPPCSYQELLEDGDDDDGDDTGDDDHAKVPAQIVPWISRELPSKLCIAREDLIFFHVPWI